MPMSKNFDRFPVALDGKKFKVTSLAAKTAPRKCSASRMRHNDAASNALVTREMHPGVHYPRMWKACDVRKADNAINTARKKSWPRKQRPPKLAGLPPPHTVRFIENDGKTLAMGEPMEMRHGRGCDLVILKRCFAHRKRDKRVALFVAMPKEYVIDPLEPFIQT